MDNFTKFIQRMNSMAPDPKLPVAMILTRFDMEAMNLELTPNKSTGVTPTGFPFFVVPVLTQSVKLLADGSTEPLTLGGFNVGGTVPN
jgi:hypothetical protein